MFGTCRLGIMVRTKISIYYSFHRISQSKDKRNKRKKTKTFGLVWLFRLQGRVAHFIRNPALSKDQPLRGSWRNLPHMAIIIRLLFRIRGGALA